ncbi:TIGR03621 family F420-dependent LLM class oxidoreductase [Oceanicoccus sp. KOV_DT_Chl]|uniref:TIGR03621 family F420-dependent LLM class oxidoreductase n=1 Tax=Oceanicoccus sp. KOV_DT_Chl TaxID=1904639 RepID=UPI000C7D2D0A|nr:TIGR03621 family F420-dependent LLM class oxidoreductase [Oceanicoccus sp. KOV_DT_Chl]
MSTKKPFRFSLQSFNTDSPKNWRNLIAKTESLGYSTFHLADHFLSSGPALDSTYHPPQMLAAMPTIAMALEQTTTLRVGCRVFCNDYRHPIMLAKEAATLDYLSEGRFEFGIGAGWIKNEYDAVNLEFDEFPERFNRFAETIHAYKAFMTGEPLNIDGETLKWSGFHGTPTPAQQPYPPIMIGGGSKKILTFAGEQADIVSLNFNNRAGMLGPDGMNSGLAAATAKKIDWIRNGAGDRFNNIELEIGAYNTIVTDHPLPTATAIGEALGLSAEDILTHPHCLIGSIDFICEELERRREAYGISYVAVLDDGQNNMVDMFAPVVARLAGK